MCLDVMVDLSEIEKADMIVDTCMPPINRTATVIEDVYLLEDFLTQRELNSMEDEAFVMFHLEPFTEEDSGYVNSSRLVEYEVVNTTLVTVHYCDNAYFL